MLRGTFALAVCVCPLALPLAAQPPEWRIDASHSAAQFTVRHMMVSNVRGHFGKLSGSARFDAADPTQGSIDVTIDVSSIDTREPKRDAHLKSADFFEVEKYPTMTFKSKRIERSGSGYRLTGDLTIRGTTREVVFDVEPLAPEIKDGRGGVRTGSTATARINRKDFGLTWNRAIETGGLVVGDEVTITVDLQFIRKL